MTERIERWGRKRTNKFNKSAGKKGKHSRDDGKERDRLMHESNERDAFRQMIFIRVLSRFPELYRIFWY